MHENRKVKLTDQVKQLIQEYCLTMAHQKSHYLRESTKLNYFTNTELNLAKLYSEFCDYYISVTQDLDEKNLIPETTYAKYFNRNVNSTFRLPRTDICNTCYESDFQNVESPEIAIHNKR